MLFEQGKRRLRNYITYFKEIYVSCIGYVISNNITKPVKNTVESKESPHLLEINLPRTISTVPSAAADFRLPGTALRSRTHGLISKVSSPIKARIRSGNLWPWRHVTNGKGWLSILSFCWGENWGLVERRWVYIFGPIFGSCLNILWDYWYLKRKDYNLYFTTTESFTSVNKSRGILSDSAGNKNSF